MNSQSVNRSTKYLMLFVIIFISFCLAEFTLSTANSLSERRFPEDFSILTGLYPNYLLFGGALLFLIIGLLTVKFAINKYDTKALWVILCAVSILSSLLVLLSNQLTYFKDMFWHNERGQILDVWVVAYWAGNILAYSYYLLKKSLKR